MASSDFFRSHKKSITKGLPATDHVQTGTKLLGKHLGCSHSKRQKGKQQGSCGEGRNGDKMHRQKSEQHQGSHCPSSTCQAGLKAETNIELTLHGPKVD